MAASQQALTTQSHDIPYRTAISPAYMTAARSDQNTDAHDFNVDGRGKGRITVAINNLPNQTITVVVYGAHTVSSVVGGNDVFPIGSFTATSGTNEYQTVNDPFPFYIIRCSYSVSPSDATPLAYTLYVDFQAF